jgi:hypothetical protein
VIDVLEELGRAPEVVIGAAYQRVITIPAPSAGSEWSITVPGGYLWRLVSLYTRFTASSQTADRQARLQIYAGDTLICEVNLCISLSAGDSVNYLVTPASSPAYVVVGTLYRTGIPQNILLSAGYRLVSRTANLQTNDAWSNVILVVHEYVVGAQEPRIVYRDLYVEP